MTLMTLCALIPPMCRMSADPAVRAALQPSAASAEDNLSPLMQAMARHPADTAEVLSLLGVDVSSSSAMRRCFDHEALALFHLCSQCSPAEMLDVLTRCTVSPTAEALALLIGERRREDAMARYGLQLLWRMNGDPSLPDALTLFPQESATERSTREILNDMTQRLKEATP